MKYFKTVQIQKSPNGLRIGLPNLEAQWKPGAIIFIIYIENFRYITLVIYYVLINKIQGLVKRLGMMSALRTSLGYD